MEVPSVSLLQKGHPHSPTLSLDPSKAGALDAAKERGAICPPRGHQGLLVSPPSWLPSKLPGAQLTAVSPRSIRCTPPSPSTETLGIRRAEGGQQAQGLSLSPFWEPLPLSKPFPWNRVHPGDGVLGPPLRAARLRTPPPPPKLNEPCRPPSFPFPFGRQEARSLLRVLGAVTGPFCPARVQWVPTGPPNLLPQLLGFCPEIYWCSHLRSTFSLFVVLTRRTQPFAVGTNEH